MIDFRQPTVLYGGSFDPVHEGHLHVARSVLLQRPDIKQVVFVPTAHSPGKATACASGEQRLGWLRLVAEPAGFPVWAWEVQRGGESFTVDTLEEAHRSDATKEKLFWLLGADSYASFPTWKNPARIRELCHLLIADRPGYEVSPQNEADQFVSIEHHPASSTALREELAKGIVPKRWLPKALRADLEKALPRTNPYVRKK